MGKRKRVQQQATRGGKKKPGPPAKRAKNSTASSGIDNGSASASMRTKKGPPQPQHQVPTIPFASGERILLVGEGDLSFAASLVQHHNCTNVTATVLEKNATELCEKYPQAAENIAQVEATGSQVLYGVDARRMTAFVRKTKGKRKGPDANAGAGARPEPVGLMDRILFNFPHVGGKSTDVNRQVRYNQELLVDFFGRALPSLAPGGSIVVTLFEGEPYTLWNIRDLGRHAGLAVERSFLFQASAYPGYHHARTLGVIRNKHGEPGGGWRGENRPARSYVFMRKEDAAKAAALAKKKKPVVNNEDEDEDEDDEEEGWGSGSEEEEEEVTLAEDGQEDGEDEEDVGSVVHSDSTDDGGEP